MDVLTGTRSEQRMADAGSGAPGSARTRRWLVGILVLALVIRVATLGAYPLMDNTEARYAEIARKIVETGDWVMPQFKYGVPFWSKPPLSMWLTAIAYAALGVGEFAARLPSLLVSLAAAWLTYRMAARRDGVDAGLRAAVVLVTTPLFFVCAGAVMTDPVLFLGTTLSMAGFWRAMTQDGRAGRVAGYAFFVGLAIGILAKGLVGVVLTLLPVGLWTLWKGGIARVWRRLPWISGACVMLALSVPWYVLAERRTPGFLDYFFVGEHWKRFTVSGWKGDMFGTAHSRPRGTIWLLALAFTLPWCAAWIELAVRARRSRRAAAVTAPAPATVRDDGWHAYLWLWMLAPVVFFTFAGNILFTYVLPGLPAFALLVGRAWAGAPAAWRDGNAPRVAGLAVPLLMLLGVVFVLPRVGLTNSHRQLVATYLSARGSDGERLVYVNEAPQSAEFYARGRVTTVAKPTDIGPLLRDAPRDFFALTDAQAKALSEDATRLSPVARFGRYTLYAEAPSKAAATP